MDQSATIANKLTGVWTIATATVADQFQFADRLQQNLQYGSTRNHKGVFRQWRVFSKREHLQPDARCGKGQPETEFVRVGKTSEKGRNTRSTKGTKTFLVSCASCVPSPVYRAAVYCPRLCVHSSIYRSSRWFSPCRRLRSRPPQRARTLPQCPILKRVLTGMAGEQGSRTPGFSRHRRLVWQSPMSPN